MNLCGMLLITVASDIPPVIKITFPERSGISVAGLNETIFNLRNSRNVCEQKTDHEIPPPFFSLYAINGINIMPTEVSIEPEEEAH